MEIDEESESEGEFGRDRDDRSGRLLAIKKSSRRWLVLRLGAGGRSSEGRRELLGKELWTCWLLCVHSELNAVDNQEP